MAVIYQVMSSCMFTNSVITGSVARIAKHRYISYSECDFEVFATRG